MSNLILPCKVQIGERVSFEIGTGEHIFAIVKAIKFADSGEIFYDLAIIVDENDTVDIEEVASANVSAIVASVYQGPIS